MSARYKVLVSTELLEGDMQLPEGLRLTGRIPRPDLNLRSHWYEFEDDGADPALNGKRVELVLSRVAGKPFITDRKVIS